MTESTPVSTPRARRPVLRRILKGGVILASVVVILVALLPTILSMDWARLRLERELGAALGTDVTIGGYGFGWFSGLEIEQVAIANPPGFSGDEKLFELRSLRGDFSLVSAVRGRVELSGVVDGLRLRVRQRADGATNLQELFGDVDVQVEPGPRRPERGARAELDLGDVRLDLELRDGLIEVVHEERGVLERLENVHARVSKEFGTPVATLEFASDLHRPGTDRKGRLELKVDAEADPDRPVDAHLSCIGLDLSRYRPVLDTFLAEGQLTAFAGVVAANARITGVPSDALTVEGTVEVEAPHLAGALLQGMDLRAPRWTLRPNVTATLPKGDAAAPRIDASRLEADLGFVKLRGLPVDPEAPERVGLGFELDVAQLAEAGGPIPELLRGTGTAVTGTLRMPLRADLAELAPADLIAAVALQAAVAVRELSFAGQTLSGVDAEVGLDGGELTVATTAGQFNGGALTLRAVVGATELEQPPVRLTLGVDGAAVGTRAAAALQYAVPLFAGIAAVADEGGPVRLQSRGGLEVDLRGPAYPKAGQPLLAWLNTWSGRGELALRDGSFQPVPALSGLLQLTGETGALSFRDLTTDFEIAEGYVKTGLTKLSAKGREFGLTGRTSLAGEIDYTLDLRDMLRAHRDGQKILEYLGDTPVGAELEGTLTSPRLAMPDLGKLAQDALRAALEKEGRERLEKEAGDLLEKILGPRRKKDGDGDVPPGVEEQARDAVLDVLRGATGGGGNEGGSVEQRATDAVEGLLRGVLGPAPAQPGGVPPKPGDAPAKPGETPAETPPKASPPPNPLQKLLEDALRKQLGKPPPEPGKKGGG